MATSAAITTTTTSDYVSIENRPKMFCLLSIDIPAAISGVAGTILHKTPGDSLSEAKTLLLPDMSAALSVDQSMSILVPGGEEYALDCSARTGAGSIRISIAEAVSGAV